MVKSWALLAILAAALSMEAAQAPHAQGYEALYRKCYDNGDPDQVIVSCTAVISRGLVGDGDLATAYKNRGNAYDDKGQYNQALADFDRAVTTNPQDADALNSRGATYTALERYEIAVRDFDQSIRLSEPACPQQSMLRKGGLRRARAGFEGLQRGTTRQTTTSGRLRFSRLRLYEAEAL
jgi:tetratricopeptide (TPR) repeat protein